MEDSDFVRMLDAVFKQTIESSRSRQAVKKAVEELRQTILEGHEDLEALELTDLITTIRNKPRRMEAAQISLSFLYKLLKLQVRYYKLGKDVHEDTLREYLYLIAHHKELYVEVCEVLQEKVVLPPFQFEMDMGVPFHNTLDKVRAYADSLEIVLNATYNIVCEELGCKGMGAFLFFHHKIIGNEAEWGKTLRYWSGCLNAYTLHHVEGVGKADIVRKLSNSPRSDIYAFNAELTGMANATHKLDRYLAEAGRLVATAARGKFPY